MIVLVHIFLLSQVMSTKSRRSGVSDTYRTYHIVLYIKKKICYMLMVDQAQGYNRGRVLALFRSCSSSGRIV